MNEMDQKFLTRAIELSRTHMLNGAGGPFGAVIVKEGKVIGEGWNKVTSSLDPTAHAEIEAIRAACKKAGDFSLQGATIYTSCEPCPMCLAAIYWSRLDRVVYANTRQDAAAIEFDDDFIYQEIPKSISERKIPMQQMLNKEAHLVFKEWQNKVNKIQY